MIKEGRAALVTSFGIFKYMAAYSLCQFVSVMILYSLQSNLTDIEFLYIDLFIISIFAFFFGKTASYPGKLVKETPLSSLISVSPVLSLTLQMILIISFQVAAFEHLKLQDWYEPYNFTAKEESDSVGCLENYTIFTVSSFQYIILAIVFSKGKPYRASIFSNYGLITSAIAMTAFSAYLALYPPNFLVYEFELVLPEDFKFRLYLLAYALANFLMSIVVEFLIIEHLVFKKLRFRFHNVHKSKRKYLAIERDLNSDTKWPILTSDFKSAASPLVNTPVCTAEIIEENEMKFSKNHVLSSLLENENVRQDGVVQIDSPKSVTSSFYESFDSVSENQVFGSAAEFSSTPTTISSFNMLGRSPQQNNNGFAIEPKKSNLEMNDFENRRNLSPEKQGNNSIVLQIDDFQDR